MPSTFIGSPNSADPLRQQQSFVLPSMPPMSDPTSPPPPTGSPALPRISDRAALEAALAGAAGLLLGRVLLGRGAGLFAGTAAIAARLLTDAATKKATASTAGVEPPAPEADPPSNEFPSLAAVPEASTVTEHLAISNPPTSVAEPAADYGFDATPENEEPFEPTVQTHSSETEQSAEASSQPNDSSSIVDQFPPAGITTPEPNPFANLFAEAPAAATASISSASGPGTSLTEFHDTTNRSPAGSASADSGGEASALPETLSPFPVLTEIQSAEISSADAVPNLPGREVNTSAPSPGEAPAAFPDLPSFPVIPADLPHPDEIWKMAAEESITPYLTDSTLPQDPPPAKIQLPSSPTPVLPLQANKPLGLFEPGGENPFAALLRAAPASSPAPETPAAFIPVPNPQPVPVLPDFISFPPPPPAAPAQPSAPVPAPESLSVPLPPSTFLAVEDFAAAPDTKAPVEVGALPVISLKAQSTPSLPDPPALATNNTSETVITARPEAAPPAVSQPLPSDAEPSAPPAPPVRSAWKAWFVLLILAIFLTFLYRQEMKKSTTPRPATPAAAQPASPAITQPAPANTPRPLSPAVPTPAKPALPAAPAPPDTKAAMTRPPSDPPLPVPPPPSVPPSASPTEPVVFAEPPPGVPQDFPPGSIEGNARQTLEKLLTVSALPEITPLIHDPAATLVQAAKWFPSGSIPPVSWKRIIFDSSDQIPRSPFKASLFRVVTDQLPLGFPVAVEETRQGPRIDFPAYVQCRDRLLDAFMAKNDVPTQPFLVLLRRGHYFGADLTPAEQEQLICFEITSPNPSSPKHRVFIQRGSDLGRQAVRRFVWDKSYTPVVELTRVNQHVEITAIVRDAWRIPAP